MDIWEDSIERKLLAIMSEWQVMFPAFVKLAKTLYVTAESTGMLSESCTFGTAAVKALDNLNPGPHKFRRFVEGLEKDGYLNGNRKVDLSAQFAAAKQLLGL